MYLLLKFQYLFEKNIWLVKTCGFVVVFKDSNFSFFKRNEFFESYNAW